MQVVVGSISHAGISMNMRFKNPLENLFDLVNFDMLFPTMIWDTFRHTFFGMAYKLLYAIHISTQCFWLYTVDITVGHSTILCIFAQICMINKIVYSKQYAN